MRRKTISGKDWLYEKKAMSGMLVSILGYRVPIRDVPDEVDFASFLSEEPAIYVKEKSIFTDGLPDEKARAFRFGVFGKEMSRLQFNDFEKVKEYCETIDTAKVPFFKAIVNITEGPAVENLAPSLFGGYLLKAYKYAISVIYSKSKNIEEYDSAFEQLLAAMNQVTTMGPVKGKFTYPEAQKTFYRILPDMFTNSTDGDPANRIETAYSIFLELESYIDEILAASGAAEGVLEDDGSFDLSAIMASLGGSLGLGTGEGEEFDADEVADYADFSKGAKREMTFKKIEAEEEEKTTATSGDDDEEELTLTSEELTSEDDDEDPRKETDFGSMKEESDSTCIEYKDGEIDLSTSGDYDPKEYEIEQDGFDHFDHLVQAEIEMGEGPETDPEKEIPDFPEVAKKYTARNYECRNYFVKLRNKAEAEVAYNKIVKKHFNNIKSCYNKLKRIFAEEAEEIEYKSSGKLSVDRTISTTVTSKVFTKAVDPKAKSNMAVAIAIDESGSMSGTRSERAKEAAINFAEIFGLLGIPTYIMGFSADEGSKYGPDHYHYTTWENKKEDRYKLTGIRARCQNFDGYSIRYASNLLNMRGEEHKVLIVISDGQPACGAYFGGGLDGYSDTKDAIREARSKGEVVLGVAIGADVDVLQKMYGRDFIFIRTGDDLFGGIMKKFTDMVKKW